MVAHHVMAGNSLPIGSVQCPMDISQEVDPQILFQGPHSILADGFGMGI